MNRPKVFSARKPLLEIIKDPKKVDAAYARHYHNLAKEFEALLPPVAHLAEDGCGKGQLTIPLARLRPRFRFDVVDTFSGPYAGTMRELNRALVGARVNNRVRVHKIDYLDWISNEFSDKYGAVISSEFLPEINSYELRMFLPECYRVIRRGGRVIQSYLSPTPHNVRQKLLIEVDSNPVWTKTPPKEWFSPKPSLVGSFMKRAGFRNVNVKRIKSNLVIRSAAAKSLLEAWSVKDTFWNNYQSRLVKEGLEIPDWIMTSGSKLYLGPVAVRKF